MSEEIFNQSETALTVTEGMKADLLSAAKWAKFMCIVGCVGLVIMVIAAICMMLFGAFATKIIPNAPIGAAMGILYLLVAALYVYPLMKGFQFANGTKAACLSNDQYQLARGIAGLKDLLKYTGILTIIVLSIYAIIIVFTVGFAVIGIAAMN